NVFGFSSSDLYFYISSKEQDAPPDLSFSTNQHSYIEYSTEEPMQMFQEQQHEDQEFIRLSHKQQSQLIRLIQGKQHKNQDISQLFHEQQSDDESDCSNEDNEYKIEADIIRQYFVCENSKEHQSKKKIIDADHRERDSKKVGYLWQFNAEYRKNEGAIFINKLVDEHNHSLAPYRKEFAPSLRSLSQEVLDEIKFLTQECGLGAKAQRRYLSKKFPTQFLYDRDLYNAIRKYKNQMGNQRENDAADMKLSQKLGSSYNDFLQNWYRCYNSRSELELVHRWKDLLIQYPAGKNYLNQLWKSRQLWAKIYVLTTFCAGMQSTQQVESTNRLIKAEVGAKTTLLNLGKAIQIKLEREAQHQRLSEYRNTLPTRGLSKSASFQNVQISQSILYCASLFKISSDLTSLPNAHEFTDGYLEDEYDVLQASLENIMNMVNRENVLEIWRVSLFDQHNHSYPHFVILLADNTHLCT
ncbi:666_t:CDS:2, partial [Racocetra persica]